MSGPENKQICLGSNYPRKVGEIQDIVADILSRLPVDFLLEYRLVAKMWRDLIEAPGFAQQQFSCGPKDPKIILYLGGEDPDDHETLYLMDREGKLTDYVTLPNVLPNSSLRFISSFKGLICFTVSVGKEDEEELSIIICNPTTKKVLVLPNGGPSSPSTPSSVGVTFDPTRNRYKVVRFFDDVDSEDDPDNCKCEIYTPYTGEWRLLPEMVEYPIANFSCPLFPTHASVGGRIYWLGWWNGGVPDCIHSMDMDDNISKVTLPEAPSPEGLNLLSFVTEYAGRLAFLSADGGDDCVDVWLLVDHDKSSWDYIGGIEHEIDGPIACFNSIVSFGNELLLIVKPDLDNFCFLFFDLERLSCRKVNREEFTDQYEPVALPFVESLFSCRDVEANNPIHPIPAGFAADETAVTGRAVEANNPIHPIPTDSEADETAAL